MSLEEMLHRISNPNDKKLAEMYLERGTVIIISGPKETGKSLLALQVIADKGLSPVLLSAHDPRTDFTREGHVKTPQKCALLIEDFFALDEETKNALALSQRIPSNVNLAAAPSVNRFLNLPIVITCNEDRLKDIQGYFPSAFTVDLKYDILSWVTYALANNIRPELIGARIQYPNLFLNPNSNDHLSMRAVEKVVNLIEFEDGEITQHSILALRALPLRHHDALISAFSSAHKSSEKVRIALKDAVNGAELVFDQKTPQEDFVAYLVAHHSLDNIDIIADFFAKSREYQHFYMLFFYSLIASHGKIENYVRRAYDNTIQAFAKTESERRMTYHTEA